MTNEQEPTLSTEGVISRSETRLDKVSQPVQPASPVEATGAAELVDSLTEQKEIEFYAAAVNGWVATRMEYDRTLVSLSAAGLALFVTLLTTVGVQSRWEAGFYLVGSLGFIGSIATALAIFVRNATFLGKLSKGSTEGDPLLGILDKLIVTLFVIGALGALSAGASAAVSRYHFEHDTHQHTGAMTESKSAPDAQDRTKQKSTNDIGGSSAAEPRPLQESFNGLQNFRPADFEKGSLDGMQRFQPQGSASLPAEPPAPADSDAAPKSEPAKP